MSCMLISWVWDATFGHWLGSCLNIICCHFHVWRLVQYVNVLASVVRTGACVYIWIYVSAWEACACIWPICVMWTGWVLTWLISCMDIFLRNRCYSFRLDQFLVNGAKLLPENLSWAYSSYTMKKNTVMHCLSLIVRLWQVHLYKHFIILFSCELLFVS